MLERRSLLCSSSVAHERAKYLSRHSSLLESARDGLAYMLRNLDMAGHAREYLDIAKGIHTK